MPHDTLSKSHTSYDFYVIFHLVWQLLWHLTWCSFCNHDCSFLDLWTHKDIRGKSKGSATNSWNYIIGIIAELFDFPSYRMTGQGLTCSQPPGQDTARIYACINDCIIWHGDHLERQKYGVSLILSHGSLSCSRIFNNQLDIQVCAHGVMSSSYSSLGPNWIALRLRAAHRLLLNPASSVLGVEVRVSEWGGRGSASWRSDVLSADAFTPPRGARCFHRIPDPAHLLQCHSTTASHLNSTCLAIFTRFISEMEFYGGKSTRIRLCIVEEEEACFSCRYKGRDSL